MTVIRHVALKTWIGTCDMMLEEGISDAMEMTPVLFAGKLSDWPLSWNPRVTSCETR